MAGPSGYMDAFATSYTPYAIVETPRIGYSRLAGAFVLGAVLSVLVGRVWEPTSALVLATTDQGVRSVTEQTVHGSIHKFAVEGTTPVELQYGRGTCWAFAAVSVLEFTYRQQGVEKGWLNSSEWVRLSEQAFGIAVLDACLALPGRESCVVGEEVWRGRQLMPTTTDGGEASILFYLTALENTAAFPYSICPYTQKSGQDHECPGLEAAKQSNPLSFSIASITFYYDRTTLKRALLSNRRLMSFSTAMVAVQYMLPCTEETKLALRCDPHDEDKCQPCPLEPAYSRVRCCMPSERESNTMEGEFFRLPAGSHPEPRLEGGHAMALVGFSDNYRTQFGAVGGWILKNSWWDGLPPWKLGHSWTHARGSHSIAYFLQEISSADESKTCPNAHSPQVWYQCGGLEHCRSEKAKVFARNANQPLHLTCIDQSPFAHDVCVKDEPLFLNSITSFGGFLKVACFLRDRGATTEHEDQVHDGPRRSLSAMLSTAERQAERRRLEQSGDLICTPPLPLDDVALIVAPVEAERYPNDPDLCGHYFFPYELVEDINAANGGFEVSDMDVRWPASAYAANAADNQQLNYELLRKDTRVQNRVRKARPFVETSEPEPPAEDRLSK